MFQQQNEIDLSFENKNKNTLECSLQAGKKTSDPDRNMNIGSRELSTSRLESN